MKIFNKSKKPPVYNSQMSLGKFGEQYASWFLNSKGYKILVNNYQARYGEIDIICNNGNVLVFCEVKTRSSVLGGWPEEAVTKTKLHNLTMTCLRYVQVNNINRPWQIDVIAITINNCQVIDLKHYINISSG